MHRQIAWGHTTSGLADGKTTFPMNKFGQKSHCSKVRTTGWILCLHVHNTLSRSNFTSQVAFGSDFSGKWDVATLGPWNGSKEKGFSCWSCVWRSAKELCWKYADEVNSTPFVYIISSSIWSEGYKELWGWLGETASWTESEQWIEAGDQIPRDILSSILQVACKYSKLMLILTGHCIVP